jgi:hypothetical protein
VARLLTYLLTLAAGLVFWAGELWLNYLDYAGRSPLDLDERYQRTFLVTRNQLLLAELGFPLIMVIAFLGLLIVKFAARQVRIALGFVLLMSAEFWAWRSFVFDGSMSAIYLRDERHDPTLHLPNDFKAYMIGFIVLFLLIVLLRERPLGQDPDVLNARLQRSLKRWRD